MWHRTIFRRQFLALTAAASIGLILNPTRSVFPQEVLPPAGVPVSSTYPETSAQLQIGDPSQFRIMQLTDTHLFQPRDIPNTDQRSLREWKEMVARYKPDLIVITGDVWYNNNLDTEDEALMRKSVDWLSSLGVPWAFVWGNHDRMKNYPMGHDLFHNAQGSLYRGGSSSGNYTVEVTGPDGRRVWEIICLNTNTVELTQNWLKKLAAQRAGSADTNPFIFAFFHIPLRQFARLAGNDTTAGIIIEGIGHGGLDRESFEIMKSLGRLRACFCGHLHKNDCSGIVDGVELVYGRSSGWTAHGWVEVRKGAKLITANCATGGYRWETVFPDGTRWHPKSGEKITAIVNKPWMQDPAKPALAPVP